MLMIAFLKLPLLQCYQHKSGATDVKSLISGELVEATIFSEAVHCLIIPDLIRYLTLPNDRTVIVGKNGFIAKPFLPFGK